jgi:hypothetical protein
MSRFPRSLAPLALVCALGAGAALAGCSGDNPYQAAESANTAVTNDEAVTTGTDGIAANEFIPDENIGSCVGLVERPNCGSKDKGGWRMYLTFAVLLSGMAFIGWRIARSVKARDAVMNRVDERVE